MPEEINQIKKKGGQPSRWFSKIPREVLTSPGGIILVFMAVVMELLDLIPYGSLTWEIILEVIFCFFLSLIANVPFLNHLIPFLIERIPGISDFLPTWLLRLFI